MPQIPDITVRAESADAATPVRKIEAVDVFRGLAIASVVLHHVLGMTIRHLPWDSLLMGPLVIIAETMRYSVPGFLFVSALILTHSAGLGNFSPRHFYWGRVRKILFPYVLWTALYAFFRVGVAGEPPKILESFKQWIFWLQYGKGYYHLYFLMALIQFQLVFPLLLPLRRAFARPGWTLAWVFWIQLAVCFANVKFIHFRFPATMAVWYLPVLTLGMMCGSRFADFMAFWQRRKFPILASTVVVWCVYMPVAYGLRVDHQADPVFYDVMVWLYTSVMAVSVLGLATSLSGASARISRIFSLLGTHSLQIFLLHPAVLYGLDRLGFPKRDFAAGLTTVGYWLIGIGVPLAVALALSRTKVSNYVFGRG